MGLRVKPLHRIVPAVGLSLLVSGAWQRDELVRADFLHTRLHVTGFGSAFGYKAQNGALARLSADYELRDGLSVGAGIMVFFEGDVPPFDSFDKNDRIFFNIKYSF